MKTPAAILAGAVLLSWPTLVNGYPILFSDTGGLLDMGLALDMGWDKPWVYGPFLGLASLGLSLWGPVAAQCLLLSHLLWLVQAVAAQPHRGNAAASLLQGRITALPRQQGGAALSHRHGASAPPDPGDASALLRQGHGPARPRAAEGPPPRPDRDYLAQPHPGRHVLLCAVLALATAAPWFASLLMPDTFAPIAVLCLFVLAFGDGRAGRQVGRGAMAWAGVLGTFAIASHLAHLVLAAGVILVAGLARLILARRILAGRTSSFHALPWRPALPLVAALAVLLGTNLVGNGVLAVSPYGSVFALARLVGDGPGRAYVDTACPAAGWRICAWQGRLPADSDEFLWHPNGPIWADGFGPIRYAPEAARLVPAIIAAQPAAVLLAAAGNTVRQLGLVQVGDTLAALHLDVAVLPRLELYFPPREAAAYRASLQASDRLGAVAAPFAPLHLAVLLAGVAGCLWTAAARRGAVQGLALMVLAGLLANAAATGALSGPHDRYQARIAWLAVLPPLLAYAARRDASCRTTSSGAIRTSAS